jgi:DNA-binding GntR family transcriptional regulator
LAGEVACPEERRRYDPGVPVGGIPIRDVIAGDIRSRIVDGALKPGTRILEEDIAADHGVSRVPVREALRRLEAEGYVELTPFLGASVAIPSATTALELMRIRRALEVLAATLAAEARGGPVADRLREVTDRGVNAAKHHEREHHPQLVDEFHELVGQASNNAQLSELLDQLRGKVRWVFAMDLEERASLAWHAHDEILKAILAGKSSKAALLMDEHVLADEEWYLASYQHAVDAGPNTAAAEV